MIPDPSVTPFNRELDPQEGIDTTLTFAAPSDARQLYLTSERTERHSFVVRVFTGDLLAEIFRSYTSRPRYCASCRQRFTSNRDESPEARVALGE